MSVDWRTLPSLAALRAFDATAQQNGFAGAARALNVTHAAVAQHVRALERELGTSLAVRDGRTVRLTATGAELAHVLADGFGTIARGLETLKAREARRGIRITATPFMVDQIIMPRLSEFWEQHPGAEISLHPARDYIDIAKEGYDLAIRAIPDGAGRTWPGLDVAPIAAISVVGIVAPGLLEAHDNNLQSVPWLEHDGMGSKLTMMRECGLDTDTLVFTPIGSPNLLLEAVRNGLGATLFSEQFVRDDLAAGRVVKVPLPKSLLARYLAVTPKGQRHPLMAPFADWVKTLF